MNIAARDLRSNTSTTTKRKRGNSFLTLITSNALVALLVWGWTQRELRLVDPSEGLGYALGIIGASMMALMLLYTLRKRVRIFSRLMPFQWWFSVHMLLGVVGPACILFHSNFSLGSPNSTAAFFAMLLMVASGLVGRYIYSRIHHGLYGRRVTLEDLRNELQRSHVTFQAEGHGKLPFEFMRIEAYVLQPAKSLRTSLWRWLKIRRLSGKVRRRLMRMGADRERARHYAGHLCGIARFSFCERLFSLWHVLHIPIFALLLVTALFHIYAVHAY